MPVNLRMFWYFCFMLSLYPIISLSLLILQLHIYLCLARSNSFFNESQLDKIVKGKGGRGAPLLSVFSLQFSVFQLVQIYLTQGRQKQKKGEKKAENWTENTKWN